MPAPYVAKGDWASLMANLDELYDRVDSIDRKDSRGMVCIIRRTAIQAFAAAASGPVTFPTASSTELSDSAGMHDPTGVVAPDSRITISQPGLYLAFGMITQAPASGGVSIMAVQRTSAVLGVLNAGDYTFAPNETRGTVGGILPCVAGDYFELAFNNTTGGGFNLNPCMLAVARLSG